MADGTQPEDHWAANGQENGENGYSSYGYRENGYHAAAAAPPPVTGRGKPHAEASGAEQRHDETRAIKESINPPAIVVLIIL